MTLATIVLNKTDCLDDLLVALADNDIKGATILESAGMAHSLGEDTALRFMASLRLILDPDRESSRTIFTVIEDSQISLISKIVNEVTGGLDQPDTGILFCVPVVYAEGMGKR